MKTKEHVESYIRWLDHHGFDHHFDDDVSDIPTLAHLPHLQELDNMMWLVCTRERLCPFEVYYAVKQAD